MEFQDRVVKPKGVVCSKTQLILLTFIWIAITVAVGVLAGLYGRQCEDSSAASGQGGVSDTPTTKPSDKPLPTEPWKELRLPDYTVPVHYEVSLFPNFYGNNEIFYGNVSVEIDVRQSTTFLLIHYKQMNITDTKVRAKQDGQSLKISRTFSYLPHEFWVVELQDAVKSGSTVFLDLTFDGSLKNGIVGLYKSTYVNSKTGQARGLATSKFEPVDARKAFPCFDEPNIKANFTVKLRHSTEYIALSNMPVESNKIMHDGWIETTFQESVPMSTYLVCFIVCDFEYKEATTKKGKPFRVYATPDKIDQVDYALRIGKYVHDLYEIYFDMDYPLPKQDMVAIPDFVSGAMEHWGLVTYRETNLLYDANQASSRNKQRVAVVIAHELAHQWFGNIVTMDWWDDLWLNEGFASYMEYKGVQSAESKWDMLDQFVTEDLQPVFIDDGVVSSHPIVVPVNHPAEITEVFDSISYSKGASVIRMLEAFMGKDKFRDGIRRYLKTYEYKNAKTQELWAELEEIPVDNVPKIGDVMDTWTRQMGYPVITIEYTNGKISATQERYLSDPSANVTGSLSSPYGYKWYVPLHYTTSEKNETSVIWMEKNNVEFNSPIDMSADGWIKFNVNVTGYYRVNYPLTLWTKFSNVLMANGLETLWPADRAGLIDDAFNLARSGGLDYTVPLSLIKYLDKETHYLPWESANMGLDYIDDMMQKESAYSKWAQYMIKLSTPILRKLGWTNTGEHLHTYLRSLVIHQACSHGSSECLDVATDMFKQWMNGSLVLHPNLRTVVYRYGMQQIGREAEWNFMWSRYLKETVPQEKSKLLSAMGRTKEVWLLTRYLEWAMDETKVRSQDFFSVLAYVRNNPIGRPIAWDWTRQNWPRLVQKFGINQRYLGRMVPGIISVFNTEFQLNQVKAFFQRYPDAGAGERGRVQALKEIEGNIAWMKSHENTISRWLENNV